MLVVLDDGSILDMVTPITVDRNVLPFVFRLGECCRLSDRLVFNINDVDDEY